jgi:uncharacterized protein (TIGR03435 family)
MSEHYTEQARRALFFARYEAFEVGSPFIETEHLLLALFRDEQSLTARLFERARLSLEGIRQEVKARTARRATLSAASEVPFSEDANHVLAYAAEEAGRLLHGRVGTEHLLLGLLRAHHGLAATILAEQGLRLASVRDQIVAMRSASPIPAGFPFGRRVATAEHRALRISPTRREEPEGPLVVSRPDSFDADGFTLRELIAWAYRADVRDVRLPARLDDGERYAARLDLPAPQSWPAIDRLVQDGIARHFAVTITREASPVTVFLLTALAGPGPGRRRRDDGEEGGAATMYAGFSTADATGWERSPLDGPVWRDRLHSVGPIVLTGTTIEDFAHWLEEIVGHPVIDETGLAGAYDIELQGEMQGFDELRQAFAEQLALGLARSQRELPMLVVRRTAR